MKAEPMNGTPVRRFSSYPKALDAARRLEAAGIACRVDAPPALCMNLWHGQGDSGIALRVHDADLDAARECIGPKPKETKPSPRPSRRKTGRIRRPNAPAVDRHSFFGFLRLLDQI